MTYITNENLMQNSLLMKYLFLVLLTLFRMNLFGAVDGWGEAKMSPD